MAQQRDNGLGYEQGLRVIGRHLDAEPAYHVSILEVEDGFTVRYQTAQHLSDGRAIHFTWERLQDLYVFNTGGRGVRRKRDRHEGIWGKFPNGHQDFFRAMGYILDRDGASNLTVDEVSGGLRISYCRPASDDRLQLEKRDMELREADILEIVEAAQRRRGQEGRGTAFTVLQSA